MEQIYTIIINESFEKCEKAENSCPLCAIREKFERDELELILGASMMEPAVRMKTNELGFCRDHYGKMLRAGKKLPVALMLESHFDTVSELVRVNKLLPARSAKGSAASIGKLSETCYICDRINSNFEKVLDNTVYMWISDGEFRRLFSAQKCFCLPHYASLLNAASRGLKTSDFRSFSSSLRAVEEKYVSRVRENLSFFIKKFDYRYENEPWGDAKDAVEKAIALLNGTGADPSDQ